MLRLKVRLHGKDVNDVALESGREYTFGRGADCDVQLEDQPGISRAHFKLHDAQGSWIAEVISKFGDITLAGRPVKTVKLETGSVFKVAGYDFLFVEQDSAVSLSAHENSQSEFAMASGGGSALSAGSAANLPALPLGTPYEGSDEATRVMEMTQAGDPYIRIIEGSGKEETIRLDGRKWLAGREEGSQILLNDRKASRRQFELMTSPQGNFVRDLGSSNGTLLNGVALIADELKPLRSGDVLQVGQLAIHFEVRDPHFERRLQIVPREVLSAQPVTPQAASYEMINYPVASGPGGAVRLDGTGVPANFMVQKPWLLTGDAKTIKAKKMRLILIAAIVLLPVLYFATNDSKPQAAKAVKQLSQGAEAFARLTPQKQQAIKEAYILGRNLFMQGKQALAAEQFRKIHEILKDGYEDSLSLAAECQAQADQETNRRIVEREMQEAAQNRVVVIENLKKCEPIANSTYVEGDLRTCLAPTYERDPGNPTISDYVARVQKRIADREQKQANQKAYASRVARGRELFAKAETLEKTSDPDSAVEGYAAHLAANLPDPDGLRAKSQQKVGNLKAAKASNIVTYMQSAETAFVNHDYKTAINNINRVKALDPYNTPAAELNNRIQREKDQKLRDIYEESVINEGLGQIDQAKTNWKKILEMDHPDGVYYKRARNKMKAFGGGS